jgi:hypothetical protein
MLPVLHELAFARVREQIAESGPEDELVFA